MKKLSSAEIKKTIISILKEHKATSVLALNIKKLTDIADYMIIATANSTVHAKALADKIREKTTALHPRPLGIEGGNSNEWTLVDFGDIIVHIMLDRIRQFYSLEKLWQVKKEPQKTSPIKQKKPNAKKTKRQPKRNQK